MKCYGQLWYESGSYANPQADQYERYDSIGEALDALKSCWNDMDVDVKGGQGVTLLLWLGEPDPEWIFPCDGDWDRTYELGPNGGVRRVE